MLPGEHRRYSVNWTVTHSTSRQICEPTDDENSDIAVPSPTQPPESIRIGPNVATATLTFKYEAQTALFKDPVRTAQ